MRRILASAAAIGLFLSLVGAYGSDRMGFAPRTAFMVAVSVLTTLIGVAAHVLVGRSHAVAARWPLHGALAALAMTAPASVVVWAALQLVERPAPPLRSLPAFLPLSFSTSLFFCLWAAYRHRPVERRSPAPTTASAAPRFLERLPPKLRGAELFAVEAEDHYLRLHTSMGQDLLLMRLADAIAELEGIEGAQTHRSWWVARAAIDDIDRADGRATLTLKNGAKAPVSRTHARALRARGWL
jgi:DNA-binding LytR/AlgR family response regulator